MTTPDSWIKRNRYTDGFIQLLAGASLVFAYAPFGLWYLIFPGLLISSYYLREATPQQALCQGLFFGLGYFGAGMSWVYISLYYFGGTGVVLATIFTFGFVALLATFPALSYYLLTRYFRSVSSGSFWLIAWPLCWFLMEWTRSWIFTGLPWLNIGHSQFSGPLSLIMPVLGADAATLWVLLIVGMIQHLLQSGRRFVAGFAVLFVAQIIVLDMLRKIEWIKPTGETISVTVVQPNVAQEDKWEAANRIRAMQDLYDITEGNEDDLIVWPEAAIPALPEQVMDYIELVNALAEQQQQTILSGIPVQSDDRYYNAVQLYGTSSGEYHKRRLVPFGEYVPFEAQLRGLIAFFDMPMSSFSKGEYDQPRLQVDEHQIAMAICYEIIFTSMVAQQVDGSDYLVTLSNDAWFGNSHGPQQHLEIAQIRALEFGIPIVRATNDGISAFIDADGTLIKSLGKGVTGTLRHDLELYDGQTLYRRLGPFWALAINFAPFLIGALFISLRNKNRHADF